MPRSTPVQFAFNGGEFSPQVQGRLDLSKYQSSVARCLNFIPQVEGTITKRPGTTFVEEAASTNSAFPHTLIPFEFSETQAYVLEFGELTLRIYRDDGIVVVPVISTTITSITQTNPAVVTYSDLDPQIQNGDLIRITASDMLEVNDLDFTVANLDLFAKTFELEGEDATGHANPGTTGIVAYAPSILGNPVVLTTVFASADTKVIRATQSGDVLYLTHPDYPPQKVARLDHHLWQIIEVPFDWPPFATENADQALLMRAKAATGSTFLQVSDPLFVDTDLVGSTIRLREVPEQEHSPWLADTDLATKVASATLLAGELVRYQGNVYEKISGGTVSGTNPPVHIIAGEQKSDGKIVWEYKHSGAGYATIDSIVSPQEVNITVIEELPLSTVLDTITSGVVTGNFNTANFAFGAWNDINGFPRDAKFFEDRLWYAGSVSSPTTLYGTRTGSYEDFRSDGILVTDGQTFTINTEELNVIEALTSRARLGIFTAGEEMVATGVDPAIGISGENPINPLPQTTHGAQPGVAPLRVEQVTLFVQKGGASLRELVFQFETDSFRAPDLTQLANHIFGRNRAICRLAFQQEPNRVVWVLRSDGNLFSMTYDRSQGVVAWARHVFGGEFQGDNVFVESIAVVPHPDQDESRLWVCLKRTVNFVTTRHVEYLQRHWSQEDGPVAEAIYLDSSVSTDPALTDVIFSNVFTGVTTVITDIAHGLTTGDLIIFDDVLGAVWLNGIKYSIFVLTANTFELREASDNSVAIDSTGLPPYTGAGLNGIYRVLECDYIGLDHLEAEEVWALGDGIVQGPFTVSGGAITLVDPCAGEVHVGLLYSAEIDTLNLETQEQVGPSTGKEKTLFGLNLRLYQTGEGLFYGLLDQETLDEAVIREPTDPVDYPVVFTGTTDYLRMPRRIDNELAVTLTHITPVPCTIASVSYDFESHDRN